MTGEPWVTAEATYVSPVPGKYRVLLICGVQRQGPAHGLEGPGCTALDHAPHYPGAAGLSGADWVLPAVYQRLCQVILCTETGYTGALHK